MRRAFVGAVVLTACATDRAPPVNYPDACGSHIECFTLGLKSLDEAKSALRDAQQSGLGLVPVGTVVAYAGSTEPDGWMICNGRPLDKNDLRYRALFDAIGVAHGGDANPLFQIPDYQGVFLRGVSAESGRDPDASARVSSGHGGSGNRGNAVGSFQADALQTHKHNVSYSFNATGTNGTRDVEDGNQKFNADPPSASFSLSVLEPTGARSSTETRPQNVAVNWIIKVR